MSGQTRSTSTNTSPTFDQTHPSLEEFCRSWAKLGRHWQTNGPTRATLVESGPSLGSLSDVSTTVGPTTTAKTQSCYHDAVAPPEFWGCVPRRRPNSSRISRSGPSRRFPSLLGPVTRLRDGAAIRAKRRPAVLALLRLRFATMRSQPNPRDGGTTKVRTHRTGFGVGGEMCKRLRQVHPERRQLLINIGQRWSMSGQVGPNWLNVGRTWPRSGQIWRNWWKLAKRSKSAAKAGTGPVSEVPLRKSF